MEGKMPEPNNTFATATSLSGDATVQESFTTANDVDVFKIRLNRGDVLSVETDTAAGGVSYPDTQLFLFNSQGRLVTSNDDATGPGDVEGPIPTWESYFSFTAKKAGDYYIVASAYNNDPASHGKNGPVMNDGGDELNAGLDYTLNVDLNPVA